MGKWSFNNWTSMETKPPIRFAIAFLETITYTLNLRTSFHMAEILAGKDNTGGAFRHSKIHPDLVGAQASVQGDYSIFSTSSTFGGRPSPPNYNPIANCCQHCTVFLRQQPDIIDHAAPYLPPIKLSKPPSPNDVTSFACIKLDSQITGVFNSNGTHIPPCYFHHIDDCMYTNIADMMVRTISASAIALFDILGYPDPRLPDPLAQDKLNTCYTHQRKMLGNLIDTRKLTVVLLNAKHDEIIKLLQQWLTKDTFTLRDAAGLVSLVDSTTRYNRWGWTWLTHLQHAIRSALNQKSHFLTRHYQRTQRETMLATQLPRHVMY
jgi:hypothetical protein